MKKIIVAIVLVLSVTTTLFSQVFTNFSVKGSIIDIRQQNTISKIETIVDENVDINRKTE